MLIGELSKQTGLSKDTIRFYEKIGLITATNRQAGTRIYKEFDVETGDRLLQIKQAQGLGFTLSEIKQLLDEWGDDGMPKIEQIRIIDRKLKQIDEKIQQMYKVKTYLMTKLDRLKQEVL